MTDDIPTKCDVCREGADELSQAPLSMPGVRVATPEGAPVRMRCAWICGACVEALGIDMDVDDDEPHTHAMETRRGAKPFGGPNGEDMYHEECACGAVRVVLVSYDAAGNPTWTEQAWVE